MGNSSTKEAKAIAATQSQNNASRQPILPTVPTPTEPPQSPTEQPIVYSSRSGRGSRHDLSFLGIGGIPTGDGGAEPRRETKQEREARRSERDRILRAKERERSIREEGVDGGYLVTMGTYTGTEDFSKPVVRQLMIERRIAPFWKGLNDHSESWTEHQLVAAVTGLPIPAPDEIPPHDTTWSNPSNELSTPHSGTRSVALAIPIISSPRSVSPERSANINAMESSRSAPLGSPSKSTPLFRGRSKTLASLTSKNDIQTEVTPNEISLPKNLYVNGQRLEAYLYKDVLECPICFLYYPPYLNRTRCCDQPICSECFVQIKRPDPHPPEHTDSNSPLPPTGPKPYEEEGQLISEPSTCPFCVQNEFGVSYEPPPIRRGLVYASRGQDSTFARAASAMSSSSSLSQSHNSMYGPGATRRRALSLSANAAEVITTDKIRPDWAKKLSDARAHAAHRSAAATALHTAAYMMGPHGVDSRFIGLGRRRRLLLGARDSGGSSGDGSPRSNNAINVTGMEALLAVLEGQESSRSHGRDFFPPHIGSRGSRTEDLEEIMLMEAIRLSLATEDDRKKKEDKEAAKTAKKEEKAKVKEQKKAGKAAKRSGSGPYSAGVNGSIASFFGAGSSSAVVESPSDEGKGKARAMNSNQSRHVSPSTSVGPRDDPQRHLEQSRAVLDHEHSNTVFSHLEPVPRHRFRSLSGGSSSASSLVESGPGSFRNAGSESSFNASPNTSGHHLPFTSAQESPASGGAGTEPMFNFGSLAAMVDKEDSSGVEHAHDLIPATQGRTRGGSAESSSSAPPRYEEQDVDAITALPKVHAVPSNPYDSKHYGDVSMLETTLDRQTAR